MICVCHPLLVQCSVSSWVWMGALELLWKRGLWVILVPSLYLHAYSWGGLLLLCWWEYNWVSLTLNCNAALVCNSWRSIRWDFSSSWSKKRLSCKCENNISVQHFRLLVDIKAKPSVIATTQSIIYIYNKIWNIIIQDLVPCSIKEPTCVYITYLLCSNI